MYDPTIGRWLSRDPIGFDAGDSNLAANRTDPSGFLECDDRANVAENGRLVSVKTQLQDHVNGVIDTLRARFENEARDRGPFRAMRPQWARQFVRAVFEALGKDAPNSGYRNGNTAPITNIEKWLKTELSAAQNQINHITFLNSRYCNNIVGRGLGAPWWFFLNDLDILNHGIAPTIKIDGTLMGTDKWGHFFQQGYWLYQLTETETAAGRVADRQLFCDLLEGDDPAIAAARRARGGEATVARYSDIIRSHSPRGPGIQGRDASGVISRADISANLAGYEFYERLYQR